MEQGRQSFRDFLADKEDQRHLHHSSEELTDEEKKRISRLRGLKDKTRAGT